MNDYLIFDTQAAAETALETIYANMIGAVDSPDLLNVDTQEVVEKDALTPAEIVELNANNRSYPIFGINAATLKLQATAGYTTAWATAQERVDGKWQFPKPADALMTGVVGYLVEPYNPDWFPQPVDAITA